MARIQLDHLRGIRRRSIEISLSTMQNTAFIPRIDLSAVPSTLRRD